MSSRRAVTDRLVRFRDLTPERLNVELQVHTTWTDGHAAVGELLARASERGLSSIALTEHVRRETDWFPGFAAEVRAAGAAYPDMEVLVGCEAKALDPHGGLDAAAPVIAESDLVLGSVHRFPDGAGGFVDFADLTAAELAERECEMAVGLLTSAPIDVLAHPGGMYQRRHGRYPDELFVRMMEASLIRGVAVEINSSYLVDLPRFLELCDAVNPYVSVGSDAHRLDEVGRCRDHLRASGRWPA